MPTWSQKMWIFRPQMMSFSYQANQNSLTKKTTSAPLKVFARVQQPLSKSISLLLQTAIAIFLQYTTVHEYSLR